MSVITYITVWFTTYITGIPFTTLTYVTLCVCFLLPPLQPTMLALFLSLYSWLKSLLWKYMSVSNSSPKPLFQMLTNGFVLLSTLDEDYLSECSPVSGDTSSPSHQRGRCGGRTGRVPTRTCCFLPAPRAPWNATPRSPAPHPPRHTDHAALSESESRKCVYLKNIKFTRTCHAWKYCMRS